MGIVVIGDVFIDVKGYSTAPFIPGGRNAGVIQQIHGGVGRNVVEDIANIELKPTFVSLVDDDAMGDDVIRKLERHKVDTRYMRKVKNGMGTWLAVFDQVILSMINDKMLQNNRISPELHQNIQRDILLMTTPVSSNTELTETVDNESDNCYTEKVM